MSGWDLNSITIEGRVGRDPEARETKDGRPMTTFSVAHTPTGEERVIWFNVACFGQLAETMLKMLGKGLRVFIIGRYDHRTYEGKDGTTRFDASITAEKIRLATFKERVEETVEEDDLDLGDEEPTPPPAPRRRGVAALVG